MRLDDFEYLDDGASGVVVLGHGSRAGEAGRLLAQAAEQLGRRLPCPVMAASLQFNKPDLADCCRRLAEDGATSIIIIPYFLFEGNHMKKDIPAAIASLEEELKDTRIQLADCLGADGRLVDIMADRLLDTCGQDAELSPSGMNGEAIGLIEGLAGAAPASITRESFRIIDGLIAPADPEASDYRILRRVIHATGDPSLEGRLHFSPDAINSGLKALELAHPIICDVNMVAAGIEPTASGLGIPVECRIAEQETTVFAGEQGITRGAAAFRRMAEEQGNGFLDGAIIAIGNAPTALMECLHLYGEGRLKPALVVGVPVGFVGAAESKQALADSGLPHITLPGHRGGSSVAVAIINALIHLGQGI